MIFSDIFQELIVCSLSMDTVEGENSVVVILPHVHSGIELCVLRVRGIVLCAGVFFSYSADLYVFLFKVELVLNNLSQ